MPHRPPEPLRPVKANESREEKFARLATRRVNHILHETKALGNLANRNAYSYTDEQVDRIFDVIRLFIGHRR